MISFSCVELSILLFVVMSPSILIPVYSKEKHQQDSTAIVKSEPSVQALELHNQCQSGCSKLEKGAQKVCSSSCLIVATDDNIQSHYSEQIASSKVEQQPTMSPLEVFGSYLYFIMIRLFLVFLGGLAIFFYMHKNYDIRPKVNAPAPVNQNEERRDDNERRRLDAIDSMDSSANTSNKNASSSASSISEHGTQSDEKPKLSMIRPTQQVEGELPIQGEIEPQPSATTNELAKEQPALSADEILEELWKRHEQKCAEAKHVDAPKEFIPMKGKQFYIIQNRSIEEFSKPVMGFIFRELKGKMRNDNENCDHHLLKKLAMDVEFHRRLATFSPSPLNLIGMVSSIDMDEFDHFLEQLMHKDSAQSITSKIKTFLLNHLKSGNNEDKATHENALKLQQFLQKHYYPIQNLISNENVAGQKEIFFLGNEQIHLQALISIFLYFKWYDEMAELIKSKDFSQKQILLIKSVDSDNIEQLIRAILRALNKKCNNKKQTQQLSEYFNNKMEQLNVCLTHSNYSLIHSQCTVALVNLIMKENESMVLLDMRDPLHVQHSELQSGLYQDSLAQQKEPLLGYYQTESQFNIATALKHRVIRFGSYSHQKQQIPKHNQQRYFEKVIFPQLKETQLLEYFTQDAILQYSQIADDIYQNKAKIYRKLRGELFKGFGQLKQGLGEPSLYKFYNFDSHTDISNEQIFYKMCRKWRTDIQQFLAQNCHSSLSTLNTIVIGMEGCDEFSASAAFVEDEADCFTLAKRNFKNLPFHVQLLIRYLDEINYRRGVEIVDEMDYDYKATHARTNEGFLFINSCLSTDPNDVVNSILVNVFIDKILQHKNSNSQLTIIDMRKLTNHFDRIAEIAPITVEKRGQRYASLINPLYWDDDTIEYEDNEMIATLEKIIDERSCDLNCIYLKKEQYLELKKINRERRANILEPPQPDDCEKISKLSSDIDDQHENIYFQPQLPGDDKDMNSNETTEKDSIQKRDEGKDEQNTEIASSDPELSIQEGEKVEEMIPKPQTIRILLTIAARKNWSVRFQDNITWEYVQTELENSELYQKTTFDKCLYKEHNTEKYILLHYSEKEKKILQFNCHTRSHWYIDFADIHIVYDYSKYCWILDQCTQIKQIKKLQSETNEHNFEEQKRLLRDIVRKTRPDLYATVKFVKQTEENDPQMSKSFVRGLLEYLLETKRCILNLNPVDTSWGYSDAGVKNPPKASDGRDRKTKDSPSAQSSLVKQKSNPRGLLDSIQNDVHRSQIGYYIKLYRCVVVWKSREVHARGVGISHKVNTSPNLELKAKLEAMERIKQIWCLLEGFFRIDDIYLPITMYTDYVPLPGGENCSMEDTAAFNKAIRDEQIVSGTKRCIIGYRFITSANNIADRMTKPLKNSPHHIKDLIHNHDRMSFIGLHHDKSNKRKCPIARANRAHSRIASPVPSSSNSLAIECTPLPETTEAATDVNNNAIPVNLFDALEENVLAPMFNYDQFNQSESSPETLT